MIVFLFLPWSGTSAPDRVTVASELGVNDTRLRACGFAALTLDTRACEHWLGWLSGANHRPGRVARRELGFSGIFEAFVHSLVRNFNAET